jgi:diguanylate cyclase (GGDEF)-like protein/PAS domain S-box-containing protein
MEDDNPDFEVLAAELKKAHQTIRDLEAKMKLILGSIHAGIVIIDAEAHRIVDVNAEASRLIGISASQIIGNTCHKYICPAEIGACPITDKGQEVDNAERVLLTADGSKIPILKTVAIINLNDRKHLLESFLDITQLKLLQEKLEYLATTDSLTGVLNRRQFFELSKNEISRSHRSKVPLSIAIADIDYFKNINDTYGHGVGDEVLKDLADVCKNNLRPYDILGRLGGEEFGITLVGCNHAQAFKIIERLRKIIAKRDIMVDGNNINITISAGIEEFSEDANNLELMISQADQALYNAKNAGRNRVEKAIREN